MSPEVLLAGVGGALLVFVLGVLREWWQSSRERNGLLRVLFSEVISNQRTVSLLIPLLQGGKGEEVVHNLDDAFVVDETWMATRIGLARHLSGADLAALTEYYRNVATLNIALDGDPTEHSLSTLRIVLTTLDYRGLEALGVIYTYVPNAKAGVLSEEQMENMEKGRTLREMLENDERSPGDR